MVLALQLSDQVPVLAEHGLDRAEVPKRGNDRQNAPLKGAQDEKEVHLDRVWQQDHGQDGQGYDDGDEEVGVERSLGRRDERPPLLVFLRSELALFFRIAVGMLLTSTAPLRSGI